jgi:hypothetical protein
MLRRLLAGPVDRPARRWRTRVTAGLTGAALTLVALGGLLALAQGARPGDLLYDLKRGGEQTQLALAGDDRGLTLLGLATTRLDELGRLVGVPAAGPDVSLVVDTLRTMDAQTGAGTAALTAAALAHSDTGALAVLTGWADGQQAGIDRLSLAVPTGAEAALSASRDLVARVAVRGSALGRALGCAGGASTAGTDGLGPRPAPCPDAPGTRSPSTAPFTAAGSTAAGSTAAGSTAAGSTAAGSIAAGTTAAGPAATSTAVPGTTAPAPRTAAAPTSVAPGVPPVPTTAGPAPTSRPLLPLPVLPPPGLPPPGLPLPSLPGAPGPSTPPGPVVSVPPVGPGVSLCLPPLITVGC